MEQQNNSSTESILVFNNGLVYKAHTKNPAWNKQPWDSKEVGFHTVVFYEQFSGKNIIASYRENVDASYIRKIVDNDKTSGEMQQFCLEVMVELLAKDPAKSWYPNTNFILGEASDISVKDYFKGDKHTRVDTNRLTIEGSMLCKWQ